MAGCVGRAEELGELERRLARTAETGADLVLLTGAPGIGKSALLRQLVDRVARRRTGAVLFGRATDWESDAPDALLRQLLQTEVPADPVEAADVLVARAVHGPTLVAVDDVTEADAASLHALSSAVRRHREAPLLVVAAARRRTSELARLASDQLSLHGLGSEAVAELAALRGRVLHPAMVGVLARHTRGNPRDVLALLDEVPAPLWSRPDSRLPAPSHVIAEVADRLAQCGAEGRALVEALAILGEGHPLGDVAALAGLEDPLPAIDDAAAAGLLSRWFEHDPRLRDPLVGAAVVDLMGVRRAAAAHRRAADLVVDRVQRLGHLVAATPTPDAALADEVDRQARERGAEGAWAEAAVLFRDAGRLTADPLLHDERLTRSVDARIAAGDCVGAAAMVPAVESLRETPLRDVTLAYLAIVRGRAAEADVRLRRAWEIVNAERDPEVAALIAQRFVLHALVQCRGAELVEWADRAIELGGKDTPAGLEAAAIRGLGLAGSGLPEEAAAAYADIAALVPHGAQAQRVTMGRGWLQLVQDDTDAARSSLEAAVSMAFLGGSARISLWALGWLARVQFVVGEWDEALTSVEQGRALAAESGIVLANPLLCWTAAQIQALRGGWTEAVAAVRSAEAVTQGYEMMRIPTFLARAHIAEAEADYGRVRRSLEPLVALAPGTTLDEPGFWPWADVLANALVIEGKYAAADALLRPHEQRATERGHRSTQARLGYARGRLLGATGELPAAREVFDRSLALLDGSPLRYDLARVHFAYGQTLRRAGKRREADDMLSAARELYLGVGATTYVERCDRELKAGGVHGPRGGRAPDALTPQEEQVADLVASGLSNREVAARLFVSPKTVQYHLTRIYTKLGVRSRTELAAHRQSYPTESD